MTRQFTLPDLGEGIKEGQILRLLVAEGLLVSGAGGLVGVTVGVAYAWLMIAALTSEIQKRCLNSPGGGRKNQIRIEAVSVNLNAINKIGEK